MGRKVPISGAATLLVNSVQEFLLGWKKLAKWRRPNDDEVVLMEG
jgi:hypothetical protein